MTRLELTKIASTLSILLSVVSTGARGQSAPADLVIPDRPYPIEIHPGFISNVSVEGVERIAIGTLINQRAAELDWGNLQVTGLPPTITRIVGCKTADLGQVDSRITPPDDQPAVWVVELHGSFDVRHIGKVEDVDGYLLLHTRSGMPIQSGVFVPEDRVSR